MSRIFFVLKRTTWASAIFLTLIAFGVPIILTKVHFAVKVNIILTIMAYSVAVFTVIYSKFFWQKEKQQVITHYISEYKKHIVHANALDEYIINFVKMLSHENLKLTDVVFSKYHFWKNVRRCLENDLHSRFNERSIRDFINRLNYTYPKVCK